MNIRTVLVVWVLTLTTTLQSVGQPAFLKDEQYPVENMPARFYNRMGDRSADPSDYWEMYLHTADGEGASSARQFGGWVNNVEIPWTVITTTTSVTTTLGEGSTMVSHTVALSGTAQGNAFYFDAFAQPPLGQVNPPPGGIKVTVTKVNGQSIFTEDGDPVVVNNGYAGWPAEGIPNYGMIYDLDIHNVTIEGTVLTTQATGFNHAFEGGFGTYGDVTPPQGEGTLALSATSATVEEANAELLMIEVTRTSGTAGTVQVDYQVGGGTATSGSDYSITAPSGTLTFEPGVTSQYINVQINDDNIVEDPETFDVTLPIPRMYPLYHRHLLGMPVSV